MATRGGRKRPLPSGAVSVTPINAVNPVPAARAPEPQTPLAAARTALRQAVPAGQWDAVMAEVTRLQVSTSASPIQAYEAVLAKLAAGWTPAPLG